MSGYIRLELINSLLQKPLLNKVALHKLHQQYRATTVLVNFLEYLLSDRCVNLLTLPPLHPDKLYDLVHGDGTILAQVYFTEFLSQLGHYALILSLLLKFCGR